MTEIIRATKLSQQAGAYYVRIHAMARKHQLTLEEEFDEHDTPETMYIVAIDNFLPIATCRLYPIDETQMMLGRIVVLSEYRHRGIGTKVVHAAELWAKEQGFKKAIVESRDNKVKFYESMGYMGDYSTMLTSGSFPCYRMEKTL